MFAQEMPEQVSPERARANFSRPVVLAEDDVRAFPNAPAGFDAPRAGGVGIDLQHGRQNSPDTIARFRRRLYRNHQQVRLKL
jgi:hypothetical protein